jgi:hypothetical protein
VAFYGAIAILFNPFLPFTLATGTWGLIDLIIGGLLGFSIFFRHPPHVAWLWASTILAVGALACVITVSQAALNGFRLSREGVKVGAAITDSDEVHEEGGYTYFIVYRFQTTDGHWIAGHASGRSKVPEPAVVVYYPKDPRQNYLVDPRLSIFNGATKDVFGWIPLGNSMLCRRVLPLTRRTEATTSLNETNKSALNPLADFRTNPITFSSTCIFVAKRDRCIPGNH